MKTDKRSPKDAIERNVSAIHQLRIDADQKRTPIQKLVDLVAGFIGSTRSLVFHVLVYAVLIAGNAFSSNYLQRAFGLTLSTVEFIATIEAIFLTVFVLINQRRTGAINRRHADLDLQISLLTENELSDIAKALKLIGTKLEIEDELKSLDRISRDTHPDQILKKLHTQERLNPTEITGDQI